MVALTNRAATAPGCPIRFQTNLGGVPIAAGKSFRDANEIQFDRFAVLHVDETSEARCAGRSMHSLSEPAGKQLGKVIDP